MPPFQKTMEFLPPVNEVWGKVMFLHVPVILSMGGVSQHAMGQAGRVVCIPECNGARQRGWCVSQNAMGKAGGVYPGMQ